MDPIIKKRIDALIEKVVIDFSEEIAIADPSDLDEYGRPKTKKMKLSTLDIPDNLSELDGTLDDIPDGDNFVKSEENFSEELKEKLDNIEESAQKNVQSNWDETDIEEDSFILNKPTIPEAQIQSDWNQSNTEEPDYIQNKPEDNKFIPSGGELGDFLMKNSSDDFDVAWQSVLSENLSHILIEFPEDTTTPPSASELYENGNKLVRIRKFSGSAINSVSFDWSTPWDMDTSKPIQYRVKGIITEIPIASDTEYIKFRVSGYGVETGINSNASWGSPIELTQIFTGGTLGSVFVTAWSGDVTISGINRDTINQILFERLGNDIADTYGEAVGITEIEIKYSKRVS